MNKPEYLSSLNPPQQIAVETIAGPLLILAGPGSGKTRVITHRIAYLISQVGIRPYNILAVTFTNKAAREMSFRLQQLVSAQSKGITLGTFHAICSAILRKESSELGINRDFSIYDADDQLKLVKEAIKRAGLDPKNYAPGTILSFISLAKSQSLTPEEFSQTCSSYFDEVVSKSYSIYQEMLSQNNALDFDDLLMKTVRLLGNNKKVLEKYQHRYSYILVDEFQDTNLVQYQLIKLLAAKHRNVCVVGDPDQSIYSWRSADIRNILNFEKDYPDAKTILLEQNYRSTSYILEAASSLISVNQARKPKELWTENEPGDKIRLIETYDQQEEARILTREISKLVESSQYSLGDMAVLFRTNAQSRAIEEALVRYGIPYKLAAGTRFYERREIKDILGYFKLIYNIADSMSLFRIINTPTRGIGKQTVEELNRLALHNKTSEGETIISLLNEYDGEIEQFVSPRSLKILKAFSLFLNDLRDNSRHLRTLDLYDNIIERIHYKDYILAQPDGEDRWQNVLELRNVAQQYNDLSPQEGLSAMLESISLVSDLDGLNDFQSSLSLITLHQAKGLEFPVVFIVGLEEGLLPHYRSIDDPAQLEEERRLFYVGITRAKKLLYLLRAYKRMLMGTSQINSVSRFVKDIPSQLIEGHEDKQQDMKSFVGDLYRPNPKPVEDRIKASDNDVKHLPQLKAGNKVRHAQFGEGIVVSVKPSGSDFEVVVAFDGEKVQIKRLLLSFARLEKVT